LGKKGGGGEGNWGKTDGGKKTKGMLNKRDIKKVLTPEQGTIFERATRGGATENLVRNRFF